MAVRRCNQKLPGGGVCNRVLPEPGAGGGRPRSKCEICSPSRSQAPTRTDPGPPLAGQVLPWVSPERSTGPGEPMQGTLVPESVQAATLRQLVDAGREGTAAGAAALVLAAQLDANVATAPSVSNALLKALDVALAGAKPAADRLDDLQKRRERKAAGA